MQVSDDALSSARTTSNPMLRSVKYMNFARQWSGDVPAIGLYPESNFIYTHSKIRDQSIRMKRLSVLTIIMQAYVIGQPNREESTRHHRELLCQIFRAIFPT